MVDFSDLAQGCKTYDEFIEKMKLVSETELHYFGIAICGAKKKVNIVSLCLTAFGLGYVIGSKDNNKPRKQPPLVCSDPKKSDKN